MSPYIRSLVPRLGRRLRQRLHRLCRQLPLRALLALAALALGAAGCDSSRQEDWQEIEREIRQRFPDAPQLSTAELAARLRESGDPSDTAGEGRPPTPLLLDARTPEEYAVSQLPGAIFVPDEEAAAELIARAPRDRPVVVYCSVGWRSSELAERLRARPELADRQAPIWNLEGSIFRWANEGRTVVQDGVPVRGVHPFDPEWGRLLRRDLWAWEPEEAERALPPEPPRSREEPP